MARIAYRLEDNDPGVSFSLVLTAAYAVIESLTDDVRRLTERALAESDASTPPSIRAAMIWRYLVKEDRARYLNHGVKLDEIQLASESARQILSGGQARIDCGGFIMLLGAMLERFHHWGQVSG